MADNFNILDTPSGGGGVFSESFESAEQTITSGAQLILAHELSAEPTLIQAYLICKVVNSGYAVGDKVIINPNINSVTNISKGLSIIPDATNLTIRIGNDVESLMIMRKNTGQANNIINTSWKLIIRAWV